jgi:malyl-CoA/(S)-citramalyl-CoA lyase
MSFTQFPPKRTRLQRSELAVPGSNPGMMEKASASEADYVFLDCEDAVAPADKEQARKNIIEALNSIDWRAKGHPHQWPGHPLHVPRCGRYQAGWRLDTILIPKGSKPSSKRLWGWPTWKSSPNPGLHPDYPAADVCVVDFLVTQIEQAKGIEHRATTVVGSAGVVMAAVPSLAACQPSAKAKAIGAPIEMDISKLKPGQRIIGKWQGMSVWVVHRTKEAVDNLGALNQRLRDPNSREADLCAQYSLL